MAETESATLGRAAEMVYPADILADSALSRADLATFGAWMKTLLHLWHGKAASISVSVSGWARSWSCTEEEAARIVAQLEELGIADVTARDGRVTVTCRRLLRRERYRQLHAERMRRQRANTPRDADVTAKLGPCAQAPVPEPARHVDAEPPAPANNAKIERFRRLWWRCKSGELKELTFRKDGVKAKVLDASPDVITLEYPRSRLRGRKCRALLLPAEADLVQECES